jgi:hypothetical protein
MKYWLISENPAKLIGFFYHSFHTLFHHSRLGYSLLSCFLLRRKIC